MQNGPLALGLTFWLNNDVANEIPANAYVAEDGTTPYVTEDESQFYVTES